jgi:hypothetical protein
MTVVDAPSAHRRRRIKRLLLNGLTFSVLLFLALIAAWVRGLDRLEGVELRVRRHDLTLMWEGGYVGARWMRRNAASHTDFFRDPSSGFLTDQRAWPYLPISFATTRSWRGFGWDSAEDDTGRVEVLEAQAPCWSLMLVFSLLPLRWLVLTWRNRRRGGRGLCPTCGYDLRATPGRCPECGGLAASVE